MFDLRLTLHTDYALRALIFLALAEDRTSTIDEIARAYGISRHHLDKVCRLLVHMECVRSTRGRSGGLRLACPPESISLGRVVRATEADFNLVSCFEESGDCVIGASCRLTGVLGEALQAFLAVLDAHSLADLLSERAPLSEALGLVSMGRRG